MPAYKDFVPVDLKPLYNLITANLKQLEQADQTAAVKKAIKGLEKAQAGIDSTRCPQMFLRVTFNRQHA
jgi:hypothetical protein